MKKFNAMVMALTLMLGLGMTSCIGDTNYTPSGQGVVEVVNYMGLTSFKDLAGTSIYPTSTSLESVKTSMGFNPTNTRMAYVMFNYNEEGNENIATSGKIINANLQAAVSLDGGVERISAPGTYNDSIATSPIISLDNVMTASTDQSLTLVRGRYLMTGIRYYYLKNAHFFTLVYNPANQEEGKVKFELRHSGTPEEETVYTTSFNAFQSFIPQVYIKTFDIQSFLMMNNSPVTIEIEVDANPNNKGLNDSMTTKKTYSIVYDPTKEN